MYYEKFTHLLHIGGSAAVGIGAESLVSGFDPGQAVNIVQVVAQSLIALVTIFATLKKAFQKPVIQAPATDNVAAA